MINIKELQTQIRAINVANGWNVPVPEDWELENRVPTFLCLIHSEISEIAEGYWENNEENIKEEMADVVIRITDLTCGLGFDLMWEIECLEQVTIRTANRRADFGGWLLYLHAEITDALEYFREQFKMGNTARLGFNRKLAIVLISIRETCDNMGINLQEEIDKKLEKNKTRGVKHGGKKI